MAAEVKKLWVPESGDERQLRVIALQTAAGLFGSSSNTLAGQNKVDTCLVLDAAKMFHGWLLNKPPV